MIHALIFFGLLAFSVGVFFISSPWVLGGIALVLVLVGLLLRVKILQFAKVLLVTLPIMVLGFGTMLFWGVSLTAVFYYFAHMYLAGFATFVYIKSTPMINFVRAVSILLSPLRLFGFNTRNLAVTISVTIAFIPILRDEYIKIRSAMNARGKRRSIVITTRVVIYKILYKSSQIAHTLDAKGYR